MRTILSIFLDTLFYTFITFLLCLILLCSFFPLKYSLVFSLVFAILIMLISIKSLTKKNSNLKLKNKDERKMEQLCYSLCIMKEKEKYDFLFDLLNSVGVLAEKKYGGAFIKKANSVIYIFYDFAPLTKSQIVKVFNLLPKTANAFILSNDFDKDVMEFANRFDGRIKLVDKKNFYVYLKEKDFYPPEVMPLPKEKKANLKYIVNLLDKRKAKHFFLFGLVFIGMSYFAPIKLYYLISGSLFLIYAVILRAFGKNPLITNKYPPV